MRAPLLALSCLAAAGCPAREAPRDARPTAPRAAEHVVFPHSPPGCDYRVHPPLAGHLTVSPHQEGGPARADVRHLHLTFVGDASRSVVVQWNTPLASRSSLVRVRPAGGGAWRRVEGFSYPLPGASSVRHHEVHVCGLTPASGYEYAVGAAEPPRTWRFRTAPDGPEPVTVMVAGDARTHPEIWGAVARAALRDAPDVMLFTGDAVADGGSMAPWARFFEAGEALLASTPAYWADGNHEGMSAVYYDQFALPENGDRAHHEHWYTAVYGPLRLVALNDVTVPDDDIRGPQRAFLDATLRAVDRARTPWVATMHHQPMHTDAVGHRPDAVTTRAWGPLLDAYRVDLDLSGHVHNYESSEPMRADGTVVPEGEGTRYFVFGGAGAPLYDFHARAPWVHHRERTNGYAIARVRADRLVWEARRADGSVIETVEIPWRAPPRSAPDARADFTPWGTCDGRVARGGYVHHLAPCPASIVDEARRWRPDALVALGGGILAPNRPACSTVQRAMVTAQLFDALGRAPWLVLSGEGPVEPARPLSPRELTCVRSRLAQERAHPDAPRGMITEEIARLARDGAASLTEADYLCAQILDAQRGAAWQGAALSRMLFEPRSRSTIENAQRASVILRRRDIRRAVIVSTPVVRDGREVDNHPRRALHDFQVDRARALHRSALGAVGCPDREDGVVWRSFEGS